MKISTTQNRNRFLRKFLSGAIFCGLWYFASLQFSPFILPSPLQTLIAAGEYMMTPEFYQALSRTCLKLFWGISIALLLGGITGLLSGRFPHLADYLEPIISILQSVPPISWLGISIIWFGLTSIPAVFIIIIATLPLLHASLQEGYVRIDRNLLYMASSYQIPYPKTVRFIILPSLKGYFLPAFINAVGLGWKLAVMAELLISIKGLGRLLAIARMNLETAKVFALALFMAVIWMGIKALIMFFFREKRFKAPSFGTGLQKSL